jgi:H+/gluconate symporter-like permease
MLLVTGAGGVFKQVLIDSGVGQALAAGLEAASLPLLLAAFLVTALLRVMQGSATVAMLSGAGLVAGLTGEMDLSAPRLALLTIAIAAGATTTSHVNDSGFWLVNRYCGLSTANTVRTWTVATTLAAAVALLVTLALGLVVQ